MSGREAILAAVRAALATGAPPVPHTPAYRRGGEMDPAALERRFLERLGDYNVHVTAVAHEGEIAGAVAARLTASGAMRLAVPEDLPSGWLPPGVERLTESALDAAALDGVPASLTGCALAIAETGTVALDGGHAQGRRALTLLPDHHLCVVFAHQLVETVPQALQALAQAAQDGRPLTLFSGPSATADIEFDRVVGVHGPRRLDVIFVQAPPSTT